jgi:RimJ/RimL family protein N-acetyltransferase
VSIPLRLLERLTDGVLVLDQYALADAEAHWEGEDEEMRLRFESPRRPTLDEVRNAIRTWIAAREAGGIPNFCYAIRASGVLVGGCELRWLEKGTSSVAVSYWCYPAFRRRGFAGRALRLVLAELPSTGASQIEAHIESENMASRRIADRAGFTESGIALGQSPTGQMKTRIRYVKALV